MTNEFFPGKIVSQTQIEERFKKRELVAEFGHGASRKALYYIRSYFIYVETIPFGGTGNYCYRVCPFEDEAGAQGWIKDAESASIASGPMIVAAGITSRLQPDSIIDIPVFEANFPERRLVAVEAKPLWGTELYKLDRYGIYVEKGRVVRGDIDAYQVCSFLNDAGVEKWIEINEGVRVGNSQGAKK